MARFNRLSTKALESFREEFISYLASQGIDGHTWKELQKHDSEKCELFIDQFSEYIILQSLLHCQYISKLNGNVLSSYHCQSDSFHHYIAQIDPSDLEKIKNEDMLQEFLESEDSAVSLQLITNKYPIEREDFIYNLMEELGYKIDKGKWYKMMAMVWASRN